VADQKTMRVFNLTDIQTPALERQGWVGNTFVVGKTPIAPGKYEDVPRTVENLRKLQAALRVQAVAVDQPPPTYLVNKASRDRAAKAAQSRVRPAAEPVTGNVREAPTVPENQQPPTVVSKESSEAGSKKKK